MPYIKKEERKRLDKSLQEAGTPWILGKCLHNAGELNYLVTSIIRGYYDKHDRNYQAINDIVGALDGAKAEFQRRVVALYEDQKIAENGDVY